MSIYLENAKRVLANAEKGIGLARIDKPCEKCIYRQSGTYLDYCTNSIVALAAAQAEDHHGMDYLKDCKTQRGKASVWGTVVCGPDAVLFEEKVVQVRRNVFQRFLDYFNRTTYE